MPKRVCLPAICLGFLLLWAMPASAWLAKGPYLQNPTQDSITIIWETDNDCQDILEWGEDENLGFSMQDALPVALHEHVVSGLLPESIYFYRIISEGQPGQISTFSTAPELCTPYRFILIGDTRSEHVTHQLNVYKMMGENPDFILNTGDIIDSEDETWRNEFVWQLFFKIERDLLANISIYPVFGNHDRGTEEIWERLFAPPSEDSGSEFYYSFKFGVSLFVIINSEEDFSAGSPQYEWIEQTLAAGYDDPEVMHIFVSFHQPGFSAGEHPVNQQVIDYLIPLFEMYGVQAVLNGHDHNFQHMEQNGLLYFVSGGGAASLHKHENPIPETISFQKRHHYCVVEVAGAQVSLEAYATYTGNQLYSFSWEDDMGKDPCSGDDDTVDDDTIMDDDLADDDTADDDTVDDDTADDDTVDDDTADDDMDGDDDADDDDGCGC